MVPRHCQVDGLIDLLDRERAGMPVEPCLSHCPGSGFEVDIIVTGELWDGRPLPVVVGHFGDVAGEWVSRDAHRGSSRSDGLLSGRCWLRGSGPVGSSGWPHGDALLEQASSHGAGIHTQPFADPDQRLAGLVQPDGFVDLLVREPAGTWGESCVS